MNVILVGVKHCGKTTLGRSLVERLGGTFHDVDAMIEATYACEAGQRLSVRDIFVACGEQEFRRIEGNVVCELCMQLESGSGDHVVALGGATVMNESAARLLGGLGLVVYLRVGPEDLFERIRRGGLPPFLAGDDPYGQFLRLYRERSAQCERLANCVVDLDGLGVAQAFDTLARAIKECGNGRK